MFWWRWPWCCWPRGASSIHYLARPHIFTPAVTGRLPLAGGARPARRGSGGLAAGPALGRVDQSARRLLRPARHAGGIGRRNLRGGRTRPAAALDEVGRRPAPGGAHGGHFGGLAAQSVRHRAAPPRGGLSDIGLDPRRGRRVPVPPFPVRESAALRAAAGGRAAAGRNAAGAEAGGGRAAGGLLGPHGARLGAARAGVRGGERAAGGGRNQPALGGLAAQLRQSRWDESCGPWEWTSRRALAASVSGRRCWWRR